MEYEIAGKENAARNSGSGKCETWKMRRNFTQQENATQCHNGVKCGVDSSLFRQFSIARNYWLQPENYHQQFPF